MQEKSSGCGRWAKKSKLVVTSGWRGTTATLVQAAALLSTATRVVTVGLETGDDFDTGCDVIFGGDKDRTSDYLDGFGSKGVDDKEQHS